MNLRDPEIAGAIVVGGTVRGDIHHEGTQSTKDAMQMCSRELPCGSTRNLRPASTIHILACGNTGTLALIMISTQRIKTAKRRA